MFDNGYFLTLSDTEEKLRYLKTCTAEADRQQDWQNAFELRYRYIKESCFNDDKFRAILMFPELMSVFDAHFDILEERITSFMIAFKWIIEDSADFHTISLEMVKKYFDEFKKRCQQYGYSLRTYYMKLMSVYSKIDVAKTIEYQKLFRKEKRDNLSDCHACELSSDIKIELEYGSEEKAVKMIHDMHRRNISCAEVPEVTYGKCVEHFTKIGRLDEAEYYAELLLPMIKDNNTYFAEMSYIILIKTFTDPNKAFELFNRCLPVYIKMKNQNMRFCFENSAYRFFRIVSENNIPTVNTKMPKQFELYNDSDEYDTKELSEYFYRLAQETAQKFDARNGSTYYTDLLEYEYPTEPVKTLDLPQHISVEKAPFPIGIPLKSDESIASPEYIENILNSISDTESEINIAEDNCIVCRIKNKNNDNEVICNIFINQPMNVDIERLQPMHVFSDEELKDFSENYRYMTVVTFKMNSNSDVSEYNMVMKLVSAFNIDNSPLFIDLKNMRILSTAWAEIQAKSAVPPLDSYMYRIIAGFSDESQTLVNMSSFGLDVFGSRELLVMDIEEENVNMVGQILEQISCSVCYGSGLRDSDELTECGIIYNESRRVMLSWIPVKEAYPENECENDEQYAVPVLYIKNNNSFMLLNDITEEIFNKLSFMKLNAINYINDVKSQETFSYAEKIFRQDSETSLLVGFDTEITDENGDEYTSTVFAEVIHDDSDILHGTVIHQCEDDEIEEGTDIEINTETLFFWRIEKDNDYYFADDIYIFLK